MRILVTNDDGIGAPGLQALADALAVLGEVTVVAPDRERSAVGHSITLNRPLRANRLDRNWYSVDGTPTDCVALALKGLLPRAPELVVAGINEGANLGDDVTYSGTVAAAAEGTLCGCVAFAVSLGMESDPRHWRTAGHFAVVVAREVASRGLPPGTLLNVNVPNLPLDRIRGVAVTRQGRRTYSETIVEKVDPRGKTYYWIGGEPPHWECEGGSDYDAVMAGAVSVTPLHLDLTNYAVLE
ncbi:MAG: 5'/3'-nucleotidase SurE, partial [Gemmatimonadales bacterium]